MGTSINKMIYTEGTFLWWGLCIPNFRTIIYVFDKQNGVCKSYPLSQGLCVPSAKTVSNVCNRFNTFFCTNTPGYIKFKAKVLKQINTNLGGLFRVLFLPPCPNEITSLKTIPSFEFVYHSSILYIQLLGPISILTKNLSRRKKFI